MTFALLTKSDGTKMGKTQTRALWLTANKCSPYDFYQYWRNVEDADGEKCLRMLTFLPMEEVKRLGALKDQEINHAKEVLAFEVTKLVHGEEEAQKAQQAAAALFGGGAQGADVPTYVWTQAQMAQDCRLTTLLNLCGLCTSNGDARKQIQQNAVVMNDSKVTDVNLTLTPDMFPAEGILLRKGKKNYCRVVLK